MAVRHFSPGSWEYKLPLNQKAELSAIALQAYSQVAELMQSNGSVKLVTLCGFY